MTSFAGSPCAKTISFPRNLPTFLPRPVESRNDFTSKTALLDLVFLGERRGLTVLRRIAEDMLGENSTGSGACSMPSIQYWILAYSVHAFSDYSLSQRSLKAIPSGSGELSATIGALLIIRHSL